MKPGIWDTGSETVFAAYAWGGSTAAAFYDMESVEGSNCYTTTIPDDCTRILFTRGDSDNVKTWNAWNETNDYDVAANNTIYVINSYHGGETWDGHENKSTLYTSTNIALLGTASASYNNAEAYRGNDGIITTYPDVRWGSNNGSDTEWFQVELVAAKTFNTIKLLCENAMNNGYAPNLAFDIQTSDNGTSWTTRKHVWGKNATTGNYITVVLNENVTAKYVRFQGVKQGTYGYTFYEFEVYNIDYSGETLNSIELSSYKNTTKAFVDETIALSVIGKNASDNEIQTGAISWSDISSIGTVANETFTATTAGEATLTATAGGKSSGELSLKVKASQVLASMSIPKLIFGSRETANFNVSLFDTDGDPMDVKAELSWKDNTKPLGAVTTGNNVVFGADAVEGVFTLQATYGGVTVSQDIYMFEDAPTRTYSGDDIELLASGKSDIGGGTDYDGGYTSLGYLTYSDATKAFHAKNVRKFYMTNPGLTAEDLADYKSFHVDVFSTVTRNDVVVNLQGLGKSSTFDVVAGEWTPVEVNIEDANHETDWIWIKFAEVSGDNSAEILVDNIYFSKSEAVVPLHTSVTSGTLTATGQINSTNKSRFNNAEYSEVKLFDLRGATVADGTGVITTQSDNGVVLVNSSYETILAGTKNLCHEVGGYMVFPKNGETEQTITFVDNKPIYTGMIYARDNDVIIKYNRSLAADAYVSFSFPISINVPENVDVYSFSSYDDSEHTITFSKESGITTLTSNTPYVLHATAATSIDISKQNWTENGLDMKTPGTVVNNEATLHANYDILTTDGSQYVLSSGTFYKGNGMKVGTFRAYLTGVSGAAEGKGYAIFVDGENETTKIGSIDVNGEINVIDDAVYNLAGQRVAHPRKGIYIVNGKKVIIK